MLTDDVIIQVRRQWNDWRSARYRARDIEGWRWDRFSGGVNAPAPQPFVHAYVSCDAMIGGDLAHSCLHGEGPHRIKVCITKKGNEAVWPYILSRAGPRPR